MTFASGYKSTSMIIFPRLKTFVLILMAIGLCSCGGERTKRLIEYVDPERMVVIPKEEAGPIIKTMNPSEYIVLNNGNYLVHKSKIRMLGDYTVIAAAAPVTITIDSAMYIVEGIANILTFPGRNGLVPSGSSISIPLPICLFK
jgi:hypothetical protein